MVLSWLLPIGALPFRVVVLSFHRVIPLLRARLVHRAPGIQRARPLPRRLTLLTPASCYRARDLTLSVSPK